MPPIHTTVGKRSSAVIIALGMLFTRVAHAEGNDAVRADELFHAGKARLAEKDYDHACPLLRDSFELDAATGTLLALAICHERQGKLASAYRNYSEVVARSIKDERVDRERAAREKLAVLATQLSRLTISITEQPERQSLTVRLNGALLGRAQWGQAIPVDGGTQIIEVSPPGKNVWRAEVVAAASGDTKVVVVPVLEDKAPSKLVHVETVARSTPNRRAPIEPLASSDEPRAHTTLRWVSIGAIGAGLVGLGASTYFTIQAVNKNRKSNLGCSGNVCSPEARQDRLAARRAGNAATITGIAGGVVAATGAVLFVLSGRSSGGERTTDHARLVGAPWIAPGAAGASLSGSF